MRNGFTERYSLIGSWIAAKIMSKTVVKSKHYLYCLLFMFPQSSTPSTKLGVQIIKFCHENPYSNRTQPLRGIVKIGLNYLHHQRRRAGRWSLSSATIRAA